jgi:hypothetical protein
VVSPTALMVLTSSESWGAGVTPESGGRKSWLTSLKKDIKNICRKYMFVFISSTCCLICFEDKKYETKAHKSF